MKGAKAMQDLQNDKEWQAIQKKYAKDREKLAQEQMRVYREKGINPFGSCPDPHRAVSKHHPCIGSHPA
jgi:YidC/Oxa1 family membrane protein insertase